MNERTTPRLTKWPFFVADAALLGVATGVLLHYPHPLPPWAAGVITGCVVVAAFLAVWPFRLEYETEVKAFESGRLTSAAEAIRDLESVANKIQQATGQWQGVQEHAARTTQAAKEIGDRMTAEARAFSDFMAKANDSEKATLRLEVEKLRRGEGQWLQVIVHLLDHVHALYQAGARSGQPNLTAQLASFQAACRDLVRRIGLVPIDAEPSQEFNPEVHDVLPDQARPEGAARIAQVIATGYSFQGQIVRRPIVVWEQPGDATNEPAAATPDEPSLGETPLAAEEFEPAGEELAGTGEAVTPEDSDVVGEDFRLEAERAEEADGRKPGLA